MDSTEETLLEQVTFYDPITQRKVFTLGGNSKLPNKILLPLQSTSLMDQGAKVELTEKLSLEVRYQMH